MQDPIYCRKKLKKTKKIKKVFKKNPKIKIEQFSISAWLEARFPSYSQKLQTWESRYMLATEGFSTCLLTVSVTHRWSHICYYLPSAFVCHSYVMLSPWQSESNWEDVSWWQAIYTNFQALPQIQLRVWEFFPPLCEPIVFYTMVGKVPTLSVGSGAKPENWYK